MSDLALLIGRGDSRFTVDARFAAQPGGDIEHPAAIRSAPAIDPLAEAHGQGFAEGVAAARADAAAQMEAERQHRIALSDSLARLDAAQAELLRQRLADTVATLCEATLAPLALDRAALARRVERAAAMFMRADDERVIRLHPDDLDEVQALLPGWNFRPDPALERGGLAVEAQSGGVQDGPAEWRKAVAEALAQC